MTHRQRIASALIVGCLAPLSALWAQNEEGRDRVTFSGSLEWNGAQYSKDPNNLTAERKGHHAYLTTQLGWRNFTLGLQGEAYLPPLRGYEADWKGWGLPLYYLNYAAPKLNVTLGSFYEQFGSGLIYRSFEERSLGINTSLRGLNVRYTPTSWLAIKAMAGQPRRYLEYASSMVYGGDADLNLMRLLRPDSEYDLTLGGAFVLKQNLRTEQGSEEGQLTPLMSVRGGFRAHSFSIDAEYNVKGQGQSYSPDLGKYLLEAGDALLINMDYTHPSFGVSASFRRIEHMDLRVDSKRKAIYIPLNYVPALTKQHKYTLSALYPHSTSLSGEIGGQVDLFANLSPEWMGRYPLKVSLNVAHYSSLGYNPMATMPFFGKEGRRLFSEVALEASKRFSRALQGTVGVYFQEVDHNKVPEKSWIQVVDVLWKPTRKWSLRTEFQHMTTEWSEKGWLYGLAEVGYAPYLSLFVSDMYSYASDTPEHYPMVGTAISYKSSRFTLSYGRSRAGMQCVGGICRFVPEYQGLTAGFTMQF